MQPVLVVGSVAFDTIHNPFGSFPRVLGGSATYASLAASHFAPVRLVGVVGRDFPEETLAMLAGRGVDLAGLEVAEGETFHWEGRYSDDLSSRESLRTDLNVFADFRPRIPEGWRDSRFVMLGNIDPELQLEVLEQVRDPELVVADTMNFWIEGKLPELRKVLERIDLLVINEEEARQLSGEWHVTKVARALLAMGPRRVVVKRGEYGALLFEETDVFSAPAYPVEEVRDPTGAGDSFAGGLLGYVARHDHVSLELLRRAVVHGSAVASFCVEDVGPKRLLEVTPNRLEERFLAFGALAHFATDEELRRLREQAASGPTSAPSNGARATMSEGMGGS